MKLAAAIEILYCFRDCVRVITMIAVFSLFGFCSADVAAKMEAVVVNNPTGWFAWAGVQLEQLGSWLLVFALLLLFLWFKEDELKRQARDRGWRVTD